VHTSASAVWLLQPLDQFGTGSRCEIHPQQRPCLETRVVTYQGSLSPLRLSFF
jgi:hypothetical protein